MGVIINPNVRYSLEEIVEKKFIPGINSYPALYNLVTNVAAKEGKKTRALNKETNKRGIKVESDGRPWSKISGKLFIQGKEIIKFLLIHNLIK